MGLNYDKVKEELEQKFPAMDVDNEVKRLRAKLTNISKEGAILILANKGGMKVKTDKPKVDIKTIDSLKDGDDSIEIAGAVVNAYELKFYEVCPSCAKRVRQDAGAFKCAEHGVVSPAYSYLWNIMLDDGTGMIRTTLFSRQVERLLGRNTQQILKFREKPQDFEEIKGELLGKLLALRGKVTLNTHTQRTEFNCKLVFKEPADVSPRTEAVTLLVQNREKITEPPEDIDEIDMHDN